MRICPPTAPASLGKSNSDPLPDDALSIRFLIVFCTVFDSFPMKSSGPMLAYHTRRGSILEKVAQMFAVTASGRHGAILPSGVGKPDGPRGKQDGSDQTLDIPPPGRR